MAKIRKVRGVGINDYDGGIAGLKSYDSWRSMLARCYDENVLKRQPTYRGCTVCDEWLYFSNFKEWFDKNYRWDLQEQGIKMSIDKDLIINGNKVHSPETCIIIPMRVNLFLSNTKKNETTSVTGTGYQKEAKKYFAQVKDFNTGVQRRLGYYDDLESAKKAYVTGRMEEVEKCKSWMQELGYSEDIINKIR